MLAHELSHVAHRDVLVMTLASSAGIIAGMLTRGAQYGGFGVGPAQQRRGGAPAWLRGPAASAWWSTRSASS